MDPNPSSGSAGVEYKPKNRLLASLPGEELLRLRARLTTVPIRPRQIFHRANEPIREVFFLNGGVASVTTVMQDGSTVEVATVGDEGIVGIQAFLGGDVGGGESMLQVPVPDMYAEVMAVADFRQALEERGALFHGVQRYAQGLMTLIMHSTACIALHPVQARLCRWLLMTHDRVHRDHFQLSHEFLATMLGSTRPTVTAVAGLLQKAGMINYVHGHITVTDRAALEAASCECYATVKGHFDRLGL